MTTCPVCQHATRDFDHHCNQCGALLRLSDLPGRVIYATPDQYRALEQIARGEAVEIPEEFREFLKNLGVEVGDAS